VRSALLSSGTARAVWAVFGFAPLRFRVIFPP
jgi:hypothetical protein